MDFTLQKISLNYFSTTVLCNTPELNNLILNASFLETNTVMTPIRVIKEFKRIESKAKKLLSKFPEMGVFKNPILDMLWPITCRIHRWKVKFASTIDNEFLNYFYWTNAGRINNVKTAMYIIGNTMVPITKRFILACHFCLVNEIYEIWRDMSNDDKRVLMEEDHGEINPLFHFWIDCLREEVGEFIRNLHEAFDCALSSGIKEAVIFLFQFIPDLVKSHLAFHSFDILSVIMESGFCLHEDFIFAGYFLYFHMSEIYQEALLNTDLFTVLKLLLYPTGQNEFLNVLEENIHRTSEQIITNLLVHIMIKISADTYRDYEYFQLFIGIFKITPEETMINIKDNPAFLDIGFCRIISKHFRIILVKKKPKETKKLNSFAKSFLLNQDKWKLLLFLIKKEIVTTESLMLNKIKVLQYLYVRKSNRPAWRRLLKFVKDNSPQNPK